MSETTAIKRQGFTTRVMSNIAILCVLSALLMRFEFALPFFPPFYKIDISEVVVLLGGFAFGPSVAIIIEIFKNLIYVVVGGTSTAFVGELANIVMGCAFILPPTLLYQRRKTRTYAGYGLLLGTLSLSVLGGILNYVILLPLYSVVYQLPIDAIISMGQLLHPNMHSLFGFVMLISVPFNLVKGCIISLLVWISYKKISPIVKGIRH